MEAQQPDGISWTRAIMSIFPAVAAVMGAWQAVQSGMAEMQATLKVLELKVVNERERSELLLQRQGMECQQMNKTLQEHEQRLQDHEFWLRQKDRGQRDGKRMSATAEPDGTAAPGAMP
jgi:septal ring factor EnvC (AmiA/AmiB activator)